MKPAHKTWLIAAVVFLMCFTVSTLGYSVVDPSIIEIRVVRYGFPLTWLRTMTVLVPPSPTEYSVLWMELVVDVALYLVVSLAFSLTVMRYMTRFEANPKTPS